MTRTNASKKTILGLAAVALLIATLPLLAQPRRGGHGFGLLGGPMFEHVAERLELSADQREEIEAVLDAYRPQVDGQRGLMRNARTALRDQIHAEIFDEDAIRQAAADVAELEADAAVVQALVARDLRQILTPEQQAEAKQMMEDARAFREHAGERFRGRRGPALDDKD